MPYSCGPLQVAWHDPGADESEKCCDDSLCPTFQDVESGFPNAARWQISEDQYNYIKTGEGDPFYAYLTMQREVVNDPDFAPFGNAIKETGYQSDGRLVQRFVQIPMFAQEIDRDPAYPPYWEQKLPIVNNGCRDAYLFQQDVFVLTVSPQATTRTTITNGFKAYYNIGVYEDRQSIITEEGVSFQPIYYAIGTGIDEQAESFGETWFFPNYWTIDIGDFAVRGHQTYETPQNPGTYELDVTTSGVFAPYVEGKQPFMFRPGSVYDSPPLPGNKFGRGSLDVHYRTNPLISLNVAAYDRMTSFFNGFGLRGFVSGVANATVQIVDNKTVLQWPP